MVAEHGFRPLIDFIIGFPDETEADRLETLKWIKKLNIRYRARTQLHYFIPIAGTALETRKPTLPGQKSRAILDNYYKGGICTQWWKKGFEMSWRLIHTLEELDKNLK